MRYQQVVLTLTQLQLRLLKRYHLRLQTQLETQGGIDEMFLTTLTYELLKILGDQLEVRRLLISTDQTPITLHLIYPDDQILNLPWQQALMTHITVSKGLFSEAASVSTLTKERLRVLVYVASPINSRSPLHYEQEEQRILSALSPLLSQSLAEIHFTPDGSVETLLACLQERSFDVLHISAHGFFRSGKGYLVTETPGSALRQETATDDFAQCLSQSGAPLPSLIVLASCQSAQGNLASGFPGMAASLLSIQVPAIIAMGFSIQDGASIHFTAHFYQRLGQTGCVPAAFRTALDQLKSWEKQQFGEFRGQCLIPQLYQRDAGSVFHIPLHALNSPFALVIDSTLCIGRRRERYQILQQLALKQPVLVKGAPGVGKTTLALHALQLHGARFPGSIGLRLAGVDLLLEPGKVLELLLAQLPESLSRTVLSNGGEPDTLPAMLTRLLNQVGSSYEPVLLIDDWPFVEDLSTGREWLSMLATLTNRMGLLITSQYWSAEFKAFRVVDLPEASFGDYYRASESLTLGEWNQVAGEDLGLLLAQNRYQRVEEVTYYRLIQLMYQTLGGNYELLHRVDAHYRLHKAEFVDSFYSFTDFSTQFSRIAEHILASWFARYANQQQLAGLTPADKACLCLLAYFNRPVPLRALESQPGFQPDFALILESLYHYSVVERFTDNGSSHTYSIPVSLAAWLAQEGVRNVSFDHTTAGQYWETVYSSSNQLADLEEAFQQYVLADHPEKVNQLGSQLCGQYFTSQYFDSVAVCAEAVIQCCREQTGGDIYNYLGRFHQVRGDSGQAYACFEKALQAATAQQDHYFQAIMLNNLGTLDQAKGELSLALSRFKRSLSIRRRLGDRKGMADEMNNISQLYFDRHQLARTKHWLSRSQQQYREIGDVVGEAGIIANWGQYYFKQGDLVQAEASFRQALLQFQGSGDKRTLAILYNSLGLLLVSRSELDTAFRYHHKSLNLRRQLGDAAGEANSLNSIGLLYSARQQYDQAEKFLLKSYRIRKRLRDQTGLALVCNNLSQLYKDQGNLGKAHTYLAECLTLQHQQNDLLASSITLTNLGELYQLTGQLEQALAYYQQAYAGLKALRNRTELASVLNNLGDVYRLTGAYQEALTSFTKSIRMARRTQQVASELLAISNLAATLAEMDQSDLALPLYDQVLIRQQEIEDRPGQARTWLNMGHLHDVLGQSDKTFRCLQQSQRLYEELADEAGLAACYSALGKWLHDTGQDEEAITYLDKSIVYFRAANRLLPLSEALHHRALIDLRQDMLNDYLRTEWEAYRLALDQQNALGIVYIGWQLGEVLCEEGDPEGLQILVDCATRAKTAGLAEYASIVNSYRQYKP